MTEVNPYGQHNKTQAQNFPYNMYEQGMTETNPYEYHSMS